MSRVGMEKGRWIEVIGKGWKRLRASCYDERVKTGVVEENNRGWVGGSKLGNGH
jgi:hypothetical protein